MADGKTPSVDIVMIFAANLNTNVPSENTALNGDVQVPAGRSHAVDCIHYKFADTIKEVFAVFPILL